LARESKKISYNLVANTLIPIDNPVDGYLEAEFKRED
jgi:hypothetical protein